MSSEPVGNPLQRFGREAVIFKQLGRTARAVKIKYRFMPLGLHMHVCRAVIIQINDHASAKNRQDSRHFIKLGWLRFTKRAC